MTAAQTKRPTTQGCWNRAQRLEVNRDDEELVAQFLDGDDQSSEEAFRKMVVRHGPMVMSVCRHALHNEHDAEDAFQATFLTLSRKAATIRDHRLLSSWLYEVAYRIAIRARASAARRRAQEGQAVVAGAEATMPVQEKTVVLNDLQPVLHDEVNRLPEKYRLPIVLAYLEGKSNEEVAELLEWPVGTVKGRLFRARNLLRSRLTRRGVALSTSFLCMALGRGKVEGALISEALIDGTVQVALQARLAGSTSALAPAEIDVPKHSSGVRSEEADPIAARKVRGKRMARLEFLLLLIALIAVGFAVYSYISTDPALSAWLRRRLMWLALWRPANAC
jgi:RNA polymerase sigma factor (sigma-70 family)